MLTKDGVELLRNILNDKFMKKRDDDEMRAFILITKFQFERDITNGDFEFIDDKTIRVRIHKDQARNF